MSNTFQLIEPQIVPPLDEQFRPAALANRAFLASVEAAGDGVPLIIALQRERGLTSVFSTQVHAPDSPQAGANLPYVERLVKALLWLRGGWRVIIGGPQQVGQYIQQVYSPDGKQAFDAEFMGKVYEQPFIVEITEPEAVPEEKQKTVAVGRHLDGCRIGIDLGASDRKVAAVIDGEAVYSEEVPWDPKNQNDPQYHYDGITNALRTAAAHLPRVDAVGVSAAGIYIDNRAIVASLYRGIPADLFEARVKDIFINIVHQEFGDIPLEVVNDGDVTALAGAMSLDDDAVLGIAMGSSEAGGYVNEEGTITGMLNEVAFVPVDYNPQAAVDEWSGDYGGGSQYFSQQAVIRLAPVAGITLDESQTPAEQLASVQALLAAGDDRARQILETIGCYLGYAIPHYADFYDVRHVLILGRVTSGEGGHIILDQAQAVLRTQFPHLAESLSLHLPEESERRVGQAIAAASLPSID